MATPRKRNYKPRISGPLASDASVYIWCNGRVAVLGRQWQPVPGDPRDALHVVRGPRKLMRKLVAERTRMDVWGEYQVLPGVSEAATAAEASEKIADFRASLCAALERCGVTPWLEPD